MTRRSIVCLGAHPDDLEVYMGGCLLLFQRAGARVLGVVATDGERGTRQPAVGTRLDEQRGAFRALGIEARFLGLPDGELGTVADLESRVRAIVHEVAPDLVFAPHPSDPHPDHACLARAAPPTAWRWLPARPAVAPTHFVDWGGDFSGKERLLRMHASQIPGPGESRAHLPDGSDILERSRERDGRYGREVGVAYAEPLVGPEGTKAPRLVRELEGFF